MYQGKTVVLGITGSIAAYKMATVASMLVKQHCDVQVIMTRNATQFISPLVFEELTGNRCMVDTFDRNFQFNVAHVSLAQKADLLLIAPASANVIGKLAHGIADDMLTTTAMACKCKAIVAPAMNTNMYENPILQDNLEILRRYGWEVVPPAVGRLACRAVGAGKMPEPEVLCGYVERELAHEKDMDGLRVLVTAGPTQEALDPVRYITNHSSGKMGYALARMAMRRGAQVTLVSGPTAITPPPFVEVVPVTSAADMFREVSARAAQADIVCKAAAVADYTPKTVGTEKMKKKDGELTLELARTQDILAWLGANRQPGQYLCGFSMETQNMLENSRAKLEKKQVDMIAANNLRVEGAGFGTDTNVMTLITRQGARELPLLSKEATADAILDAILSERNHKTS
ncbi:MAG: bifunctional phosphopantothenoylcysteine decarboxylase/phosphopantothenate--cysteine ligase CoaBC [Eubacteriales bacterium]|jgi:phosphopantothenoylcysteine decarboxylase/phosphopantothenate--cysteine ligase